MAPKIGGLRCSVQAFDHDDIDDMPDVADEYESQSISTHGYLQIDNYRSYRKNSGDLKVSRWVSLPEGTPVAGVSCSLETAERAKTATQPRRSCLRRSYSYCCADAEDWETRSSASTDSTAASSTDGRKVSFADEILSVCDDDSDFEELSIESAKSPLAQWIFIDRDMCGFSLHEYAPDEEAVADFASSPYGLMFLEELETVHCLNAIQQQMVPSEEENAASWREERQLDKALLSAGVHVNLIHCPAEDRHEPCVIEVSI